MRTLDRCTIRAMRESEEILIMGLTAARMMSSGEEDRRQECARREDGEKDGDLSLMADGKVLGVHGFEGGHTEIAHGE